MRFRVGFNAAFVTLLCISTAFPLPEENAANEEYSRNGGTIVQKLSGFSPELSNGKRRSDDYVSDDYVNNQKSFNQDIPFYEEQKLTNPETRLYPGNQRATNRDNPFYDGDHKMTNQKTIFYDSNRKTTNDDIPSYDGYPKATNQDIPSYGGDQKATNQETRFYYRNDEETNRKLKMADQMRPHHKVVSKKNASPAELTKISDASKEYPENWELEILGKPQPQVNSESVETEKSSYKKNMYSGKARESEESHLPTNANVKKSVVPLEPDFTYVNPTTQLVADSREIQFAVPPWDPRYYESHSGADRMQETLTKIRNSVGSFHSPYGSVSSKGGSPDSFFGTIFGPYTGFAVGLGAMVALAFLGLIYKQIKIPKDMKKATEYPTYGVTGPQKLDQDGQMAKSAELQHYQKQKSRAKNSETSRKAVSEPIVYECHGLAIEEEMEIVNPLFKIQSKEMIPPKIIATPPDEDREKTNDNAASKSSTSKSDAKGFLKKLPE